MCWPPEIQSLTCQPTLRTGKRHHLVENYVCCYGWILLHRSVFYLSIWFNLCIYVCMHVSVGIRTCTLAVSQSTVYMYIIIIFVYMALFGERYRTLHWKSDATWCNVNIGYETLAMNGFNAPPSNSFKNSPQQNSWEKPLKGQICPGKRWETLAPLHQRGLHWWSGERGLTPQGENHRPKTARIVAIF